MNKEGGEIGSKKGQFYLIAALIIIVALFAVIGVTNYVSTRQSNDVSDLIENLDLEAENVIEYGAVYDYDLNEQLTKFASEFANLEDDYNYFFFYGDEEMINSGTITVYVVEKVNVGGIILETGGNQITWVFEETKADIQDIGIGGFFNAASGILTVTLDETNYNIEIKEGQNFYLVVRGEENG